MISRFSLLNCSPLNLSAIHPFHPIHPSIHPFIHQHNTEPGFMNHAYENTMVGVFSHAHMHEAAYHGWIGSHVHKTTHKKYLYPPEHPSIQRTTTHDNTRQHERCSSCPKGQRESKTQLVRDIYIVVSPYRRIVVQPDSPA